MYESIGLGLGPALHPEGFCLFSQILILTTKNPLLLQLKPVINRGFHVEYESVILEVKR